MALADHEDRMADSLVWVSDQCIFMAQHGEAYRRFREDLERQEAADLAARTPVAASAVTEPVGGSVVSIFDRVRARR
ncbi:hypothetical protein JRF84_08115 [Methylobacterium organophilum]|uniref:hypothetical protein n=1 Tax=Methylobacterium TaxID=407 RepID=UPI0019D04A88|nr:hypothetical protein [Methylobacterium organophilum]MBN6819553.1 hypothetical protein [Methylobacterium organophilum]